MANVGGKGLLVNCLNVDLATMQLCQIWILQPFPYLGLAPRAIVLHVLRSRASSVFTCFFFMSFCITSLHLGFYFPVFLCPLTSMFSLLHLPLSFLYVSYLSQSHFSNFLTSVYHTCPCSYFFCPDLVSPLYFHHPPQHSYLFFLVNLVRPSSARRPHSHTSELI